MEDSALNFKDTVRVSTQTDNFFFSLQNGKDSLCVDVWHKDFMLPAGTRVLTDLKKRQQLSMAKL